MIESFAAALDLLLTPKPSLMLFGTTWSFSGIIPLIYSISSCVSVERGERPTVHSAAVLFKNMCYNNKDNLQAGIIVAGWDKYEGGTVYNIPLGGSLHKQPFAIGGSGSTYIYGYCDSVYRPDMTRQEAQQFVINALSLAMSRDGSSGGIIRLAVITEAGVDRSEVLGNELPTFWQG